MVPDTAWESLVCDGQVITPGNDPRLLSLPEVKMDLPL